MYYDFPFCIDIMINYHYGNDKMMSYVNNYHYGNDKTMENMSRN